MSYAPFARGRHPVGVTSDEWFDANRDCAVSVEIWYPAAESYRGQDLDPATWDEFPAGWAAEGEITLGEGVTQTAVRSADQAPGTERPLVLLLHGWAGFRREATFIGTHLASHGYVVVSPDVRESTYTDVDAFLLSQEANPRRQDLLDHLHRIADVRRGDIPFLVSTAVERLGVRPTGVGITGASFGGWSSLIAPGVDERITAIAPMCPASDDSPVVDRAADAFDHGFGDWTNDAATLLLVADRDSLLPLYGQMSILRSVPSTDKQMVVLERADHNHFVDDIDNGHAWLKEFAERVASIYPDGPGRWPAVADSVRPIAELTPGAGSKIVWQGLLTAHFDRHLRGMTEAEPVLADPDRAAAEQGVVTTTVRLAGATK